jgi:lysophospholipase L1-like esterase
LLVLTVALCASGAAVAQKNGKGGGGGGGGGGGKGGGKGGGGGGGGTTTAVHLEGVGDSIMRGLNASCTRNDLWGLLTCVSSEDSTDLQYSFFDGASGSVMSLRDRYATISASVTASQGAAAVGSEMTDPAKNNFATQAATIVASLTAPSQVIVELGGNDLCNRSPGGLYDGETWRLAVKAGLDVLVNGLPDGSTVYLASVPRVQDLYAAGVQKQGGNISCTWFWQEFDICPIVTSGNSSDIAAVAQQQQLYNEILRDSALLFNSRAAETGVEVVAEYGGQSHASMGTYSFGAGDINGGDCFHPSTQGQNKISELLWTNDPFN